MNTHKLLHQSKRFLEKNSATILTCVGGVGVVATTVMAVKATPKALELLEKAKEEKGGNLTKFEAITAAGYVYIPTIIVGTSTIACIFGANILNKRHQAALTSAYAVLNSTYQDYKNKVVELYGEDAHREVREEIAKDRYEENEFSVSEDKQLFYDEYSERYFESTLADVLRAEYEINKKISLWGGAHLNEFYEHLDMEPVEYGTYVGWSSGSLMETKWTQWLDFKHEKVVMDDGLECYIISFSDEPLFEYDIY